MPGGSTNFKTQSCQQAEGAWLSGIRKGVGRWEKQAGASKDLNQKLPKGNDPRTETFLTGALLSSFHKRLHSALFLLALSGNTRHEEMQISVRRLESLPIIFLPPLGGH